MQWLWCRDGKRRLFEHSLVDVRALTPDQVGWVPGRTTVHGRSKVAMAPIEHMSRGKAEAAQRVAVLHRCPEFLAQYERVFGDTRPAVGEPGTAPPAGDGPADPPPWG